MYTALAQGLTKAQVHIHPNITRACVILLWVLFLISSTPPFTSSPSSSSLWSLCCSCCPTPSPSLMSWINALRTSAEEIGTLAENEPPTGYEPNDHFITEAYVEYTQESSSEQRFPCSFHCHRHVSCASWVTLSDLSIHLTFHLFISFIFLHFLLPFTFLFLDVRALPLRSWVPRTKRTPPQVLSPTTTSSRRLMSSSPRSRAWRLRLRWRHHRQDAPWRVPKTSRSRWRRSPVVLSVVVSKSW